MVWYVQCINALPPCSSSSSMVTVLLNLSHNTCDDQEESKKRDMAIIKIRSCSHNGQADLFGDNANIVRNEVVLAQNEINSQKQSKYEFDLLFLGQKNGLVGIRMTYSQLCNNMFFKIMHIKHKFLTVFSECVYEGPLKVVLEPIMILFSFIITS